MQVPGKSAENPLHWWKAHESQFPTVAFLARQVLGIVGSQIEMGACFLHCRGAHCTSTLPLRFKKLRSTSSFSEKLA